MIMPRGNDQLLLPVRPLFIVLTMALAVALQMMPVGRQPGMPDWVALVLVCWIVHQPLRVGVGMGFVLGLVVDVHQGALLGQHALAYTLQAFLAISLHRRLLWFSLLEQALQILPLFIAGHLVSLLVRMLAGGMFPGPWLILAPLLEAALWPVVTWLLLAPQRRAPDPDENRPL